MPDFTYTARTSDGQATSGTIAADSIGQAIQAIRAEGRFPVSVKPATAVHDAVSQASVARGGVRISRAELIQLSTQLAIMIQTGVQLTEALDCIAKQSDRPKVQALVADVSQRIQGGASFSEALARHPRSFPMLYLALIRASEKSGMLARLLSRATAYLRDEQETIRKVRGALIYPMIMLSFAMVTTIFLLTFVLPRFTVIYAAKQAALPLPTKILMGMSNFLVHHWMGILTVLGALIAVGFSFFRSTAGAAIWHSMQLNVPLFGALYRKVHLARGLRMVGTMAGAGVALMDCINVAHDLCANSHFRQLWRRAGEQIQSGKQFSDPLFDSPLVPRSVAQMIYSGEKSGKLAQVMDQVSGYAEQELKEQIAALTRYIEPAMIILMGFIIGGICLALLMPIFTISKVMAH